MQNHNCALANCCDSYAMDSCQGCSRAGSSRSAFADAIIAGVVNTPKITRTQPINMPTIKNVIFNDPATIVIWSDGTKTVVKCQYDDLYSAETGLAMAIAKKALGNKGNFNEVFKKWIPDYENEKIPGCKVHGFELNGLTLESIEPKKTGLFHRMFGPGEITFTFEAKKEDK